MSIRRTSIDRLNEARKSGRPTIAKGKPLNAQGDDGDLTFRRTSDGLKLYIKAAGKWNGVKVGESFDDLEKSLKSLQKIVSTIKKFRLPNTYSVTGDFTLDASGDITLNADDGHVEFDGCGVGFDKETTTFADSAVLGQANDSTDIDFRLGNKHELTITDDIAGSGEHINMIFPATSGNFTLVLIQGNSSCTVASGGWKVYISDGSTEASNDMSLSGGSDGTDGEVRWAGGTAPTLTTTQYKSDIISIYWDADNQTAFGVVSFNF